MNLRHSLGAPPASLRVAYAPRPNAVSNLDAPLSDLRPSAGDRLEADMLDLIYLALGLAAFVLFGVYAAALRRL